MVWFGVMSPGSGLAVDHEPSPIRPHPFEPTASRHTFSKVISIVAFCSKRTRLLTVRKQNLQKKPEAAASTRRSNYIVVAILLMEDCAGKERKMLACGSICVRS